MFLSSIIFSEFQYFWIFSENNSQEKKKQARDSLFSSRNHRRMTFHFTSGCLSVDIALADFVF